MKPSLPSLCAALVVALAGCASGLDRLGSVAMTLSDEGFSRGRLTLLYDEEKQGCQTLEEDFSVDVDGTSADSPWRGGSTMTLGFQVRCPAPTAVFPRVSRLGVSTITASAGGDAMVMEVQDMGLTLGAEPILAPGEAVHVGQLLRLAVDPGFDRVEWDERAWVLDGNDELLQFVPIAPPSASGVLEVQLPSDLPAGLTHVNVEVTASPKVMRCEGADSCAVPLSWNAKLVAQVDVLP